MPNAQAADLQPSGWSARPWSRKAASRHCAQCAAFASRRSATGCRRDHGVRLSDRSPLSAHAPVRGPAIPRDGGHAGVRRRSRDARSTVRLSVAKGQVGSELFTRSQRRQSLLRVGFDFGPLSRMSSAIDLLKPPACPSGIGTIPNSHHVLIVLSSRNVSGVLDSLGLPPTQR
jgi:hypothetical protein